MESLLLDFFHNTGYYLADYRNVIMMIVGCTFIYLGIAKHYEPLLLVPIGFGILMGNVPVFKGLGLSIYEDNSVLHYLYMGVKSGVYPPLIFMGIGAMTDFSTMLARPVLMLLGAAAAQIGVFHNVPVRSWHWGFPSMKPLPSGSSAAPTAPRRFFYPPNWHRTSSGPLLLPPILIWRLFRSSSRPSCDF